MFTKLDGPPIQKFKPKTYKKLWLEKHHSANNTQSRQCENKKLEDQHSTEGLWEIVQ